jgi:hypothetical protein
VGRVEWSRKKDRREGGKKGWRQRSVRKGWRRRSGRRRVGGKGEEDALGEGVEMERWVER